MVGGVHHWYDLEVQILVLVSFLLQLFLLTFAGRRRRNISVVLRILLWLAYVVADSIVVYTIGQMSNRIQSYQHQQLMAFWAPFLLVHLGGQDTITAYALEDNDLWLRHLLNLMVQVVLVGYVLFNYIAGSWTLGTASLLVFVVGFLKYAERVSALRTSRLDYISKFLQVVERPRMLKEARGAQAGPLSHAGQGFEEILQGAHDLFPICMGQFVGHKFWPSPRQSETIKLYADDSDRMYKLIEMQLSLMHDILYTKAAVIHTRCGCFIRAASLVATISAFFLFQSTAGKNDFKTVDVIVTYIVLAGALLLEITTALRAMGSTWTCEFLRARRWHRLHNIAISFRRWVKTAERNRRWSGSIGQHRLLDLSDGIEWDSRGCSRSVADLFEWKELYLSFTVISESTKELVLKEIVRMVEACEGKEEILRNYNGQFALEFFEDPTSSTGIDFDEKVLTWHSATEIFISRSSSVQEGQKREVVEAIRALSNYIVSLLMEHPYILPSPVRPGLYANTESKYAELGSTGLKVLMEMGMKGHESIAPPSFVRGAQLAEKLREKGQQNMEKVLQVVLGVWVEMLCYAAHRGSMGSHARQLNRGGEFITVVLLLTTAMFNRRYCDEDWFKERVDKFFTPPRRQVPRGLKQLFVECLILFLP